MICCIHKYGVRTYLGFSGFTLHLSVLVMSNSSSEEKWLASWPPESATNGAVHSNLTVMIVKALMILTQHIQQ